MSKMMQVRIRKPSAANGGWETDWIDLHQLLIAMLRAGIERDVDDRDPSPAEIDAAADQAAKSALANLNGRIDEALRQLSVLRVRLDELVKFVRELERRVP